MKILELTHFSEGACGVWTRAREEAIRLAKKGHEVLVFSSNAVKGKDGFAKSEEKIDNINIKRFPYFKLGGESFMSWRFEKDALEFSPDIIIAHNYRQLHTTRALKIAKQLRRLNKKCRVYLVTHAPFVEGDITRKFQEKLAVKLYDFAIGRMTINQFEKILAISNWEIPYLKKIGAKENNIIYIPNGIPEEFFRQKPIKEEEKILFLGRISPKKKLETLVDAISLLKNKKVKVEIVGPKEEGYSEYIESKIKKNNLSKRISILPPIYNISEKIKKIDSAKVYVLPSRVEGMPQSLIEAMAREKIAVGSNSIAIRGLIKDNKNGYLFEFDNPKDLARVLDVALKSSLSIKKEAKKSVQEFSWENVIKKIDKVIYG